MIGSFADAEAVNIASVDWVPTKAAFTSALNCTSTGTVYVDMLGFGSSAFGTENTGSSNIPIAMIAGETLNIAVVKVHKTSTTGAYTALYGPGL